MKSKTIRLSKARTSAALLQGVFSGLLPFLLTSASLMGGLSPFSAAFTGAVPFCHCIPAAIGALTGLLLFQPVHLPLRLATLLLLTAMRFAAQKLFPKQNGTVFRGAMVLGAGAVTLTFYTLLTHLSTASLFLLIIELTLSVSACVLFARGLAAIEPRTEARALRETERIGICAIAAALLISLSALSLFQINPGIVLSCVLILLAANTFGAPGASVAGILAAGSLCLASDMLFPFAVTLAVGAFFAGAFRSAGRFAPMIALLACSIFVLFLLGVPSVFAYSTVALFIGSAVYLLLPSRVTQGFAAAFGGIQPSAANAPLADRLRILSDAAHAVRQELSQVTEKFNRIDYHNITSVCESAASTVCKSCEHCLSCWDTRYNETMDALKPLEQTLRQNGSASPDTLPRHFREICRYPESLCRAINARYRVFLSQEGEKRQVRQSQLLMLENLDTLSETLTSLEKTFRAPRREEEAVRSAVIRALEKLGETVSSVEAVRLADGSMQVRLGLFEADDDLLDLLGDAIHEESGILFPPPAVIRSRALTHVLYSENALYRTECGIRQTARSGNHICGDACETFTDALGRPCFLLSDGMGTGGRAAIDSLMTCSMLKRLLSAGFTAQAALRLTSNALSVKSADESTATVDLLTLDPISGTASFLKAGAAVSLLCRGGQIRVIGHESLPVGIVQPPSSAAEQVQLADGDVILMLSDGALANGTDILRESLLTHAHRSASEIAFAIGSALQQKEGQSDDISVLVVRITKTNR